MLIMNEREQEANKTENTASSWHKNWIDFHNAPSASSLFLNVGCWKKKNMQRYLSHMLSWKMTMQFLFVRTLLHPASDNPETRKQRHKCKAQWLDEHIVQLSN